MTGAPAGSLTPAEWVTASLLLVLLVLVAIMGVQAWNRARLSAAEIERRRRKALSTAGKLADANILEVRDDLIFYSYEVRGAEYTACQDLTGLEAYLPPDPAAVNGPVHVKYDPGNPANSIVLAEGWTGFRTSQDRF